MPEPREKDTFKQEASEDVSDAIKRMLFNMVEEVKSLSPEEQSDRLWGLKTAIERGDQDRWTRQECALELLEKHLDNLRAGSRDKKISDEITDVIKTIRGAKEDIED
ncbi:MAG: hypothetical protein GF370_00845 [Candidatus Nealsonbacteria bacterium]|nr:hypothetical protein [Candidatus Nealsonbacteria bacterium]